MTIEDEAVLSRSREMTAERSLDSAPISSWQAVDLQPVLRGERVTLPPSVLTRDDGICLLYAGRLNAAIGETESLKSWFAAVATKQELAEGHHVIYIDFEDTPETAVERLRALGATEEQIDANLSYLQPDGRFDDLAKMVVEDKIEVRGAPTLVVIDGVTEAMGIAGLDPISGPDVAAFYASFPSRLARTGAAVLLVDHVTKGTENRGRWAIGSERKLSGLGGAAYGFDVIATFGRGRTGKVKITLSKDRCGHVRQHETAGKVITFMELKSWPDGGVTASLEVPKGSTDVPFRPTEIMEKLSKLVEGTPGMGVKQLRAAVSCKATTTDLALEILVNEGYFGIESGPRGMKRHVSLRPFRAAEDEDGVTDDDF
jgi:hypothetical protein